VDLEDTVEKMREIEDDRERKLRKINVRLSHPVSIRRAQSRG
jgi:hypothetical protein